MQAVAQDQLVVRAIAFIALGCRRDRRLRAGGGEQQGEGGAEQAGAPSDPREESLQRRLGILAEPQMKVRGAHDGEHAVPRTLFLGRQSIAPVASKGMFVMIA